MPTTPMQALPYPPYSAPPNVPDDLQLLAAAVDDKLVMRFATSTARNSAIPVPVDGMLCALTSTKEYQVYSNGAWRTFYANDGNASATRFQPTSTYVSSGSGRPSAASQQHGAIGYNRQQGTLEVVMGDGIWHAAAARKIGGWAYQSHDPGWRLQPNQAGMGGVVGFDIAAAAYINVRGVVNGYADGSRFGSTSCYARVYLNAMVGIPGGGTAVQGNTSRQFKYESVTQQGHMCIPYEMWFLATTPGHYSCHIQTYNTSETFSTDFVINEQFIAVEPCMGSALEYH